MNPLILRPPLLAVHKAGKKKGGRKDVPVALRAQQGRKAGEWLRTRSGRDAFIAQNSPAGFLGLSG
ncbi:MAG: hypothetical protein VX387_01790 [Planctomycetota bacterium]|nr:hypothetical protein [Planctomycetota bacterium]MEC9348425.1 hypothetical protein [Planctomycetota bacterium]